MLEPSESSTRRGVASAISAAGNCPELNLSALFDRNSDTLMSAMTAHAVAKAVNTGQRRRSVG